MQRSSRVVRNGRQKPAVARAGVGIVEIHDARERQILDHLAGSEPVTQRRLASELGIALGLTNLLMRRLVTKGWVRMKRVSPRRIRYLLTPSGVSAQARLTREYFLSSLRFYLESRQRVRDRLAVLSEELQGEGEHGQHIVFYGTGEIAEVAYVCLRETSLELVGAVDGGTVRPLFDVQVHCLSDLDGAALASRPFARLVVMPLQDEAEVRAQLVARAVPEDRVFWL
jgi:DNA-binding MarR family transcriptional regulator